MSLSVSVPPGTVGFEETAEVGFGEPTWATKMREPYFRARGSAYLRAICDAVEKSVAYKMFLKRIRLYSSSIFHAPRILDLLWNSFPSKSRGLRPDASCSYLCSTNRPSYLSSRQPSRRMLFSRRSRTRSGTLSEFFSWEPRGPCWLAILFLPAPRQTVRLSQPSNAGMLGRERCSCENRSLVHHLSSGTRSPGAKGFCSLELREVRHDS